VGRITISWFCVAVLPAVLLGGSCQTTPCAAEEGIQSLNHDDARLDDEYGFRGVKFGSSPKDTKGMTAAYDKEDVSRCYARQGEPLTFGQAKLNRIRYCFYKDQLHMIGINAEMGLGNARLLLHEISQIYGAGSRLDPNKQTFELIQEQYVWEGKMVRMRFTLFGGGEVYGSNVSIEEKELSRMALPHILEQYRWLRKQ
jgi:hypothetical protein